MTNTTEMKITGVYSLTSKGKTIASARFTKKSGWVFATVAETDKRIIGEVANIDEMWKAFKAEVQQMLGVSVKRGRPSKFTDAEKAAKLAEKETAKAAKKAEKDAALANKPVKAPKAKKSTKKAEATLNDVLKAACEGATLADAAKAMELVAA